MKTLLSFALTLTFLTGLFGQNDAIDRFFQGYQNDENFTMVFISPKMFQMASKVVEGQEEDIKNLVKGLKGLKILTSEVTPQKYYDEALRMIPTDEYQILMTVRDKGSNVKFLTKESAPDVIEELLLLIGGDDEFVLMSFVGQIDLENIGKLANKLDIEGAEQLEKLENK